MKEIVFRMRVVGLALVEASPVGLAGSATGVQLGNGYGGERVEIHVPPGIEAPRLGEEGEVVLREVP